MSNNTDQRASYFRRFLPDTPPITNRMVFPEEVIKKVSEPRQERPLPKKQRRRRRRKGMRWYRDLNVGPADMRENSVAKFYLRTTDDDGNPATPEIYMVVMRRDTIMKDGVLGLKTSYGGDIDRNAVPISNIDPAELAESIKSMQACMDQLRRREAEGYRSSSPRPGDEALTKMFSAITSKLFPQEERSGRRRHPPRAYRDPRGLFNRLAAALPGW